MAKNNREMSDIQKEMLDRLKKEDKIYWKYTKTKETHSLTCLVKRGLVSVNELNPIGNNCERTYWTLR